MKFRVGVIGCGRMANTIEDEQIARRKERPYRGGLVLPYSHAAGYAKECHNPFLIKGGQGVVCWLVPDDFGVSVMTDNVSKDRVILILRPGLSSVVAIGDALNTGFFGLHNGIARGIESHKHFFISGLEPAAILPVHRP